MGGLLAGKRIVITGAARGLGWQFAQDIAGQGARVVMLDILAAELEASAEQLRKQGARVEALPLDIADPQAINDVMQLVAREGGIDGLVNNAALATGVGGKNMLEYDIELWDRVMQVNVRGSWLVSKAAVPLMKRGGKIVNVASDTALWGAPNLLAYVASKGAIIAMTRSMARELGERGLCVNAIAPGLTRVAATEYVPAARHQLYEQGRSLAGAQHPQDVSGSVIWLLSSLSDFVTGQLLPVNGGFVFN
ncbi:SDR family oxidoreductase [Erwinia sp. V90_4]|uniref:SDR family oxidoreductase n=1 Tax=Erwinia sp. V90_4 TaxID=3044239 RepID=UPI00249E2479|nr:SDR family oxidoreductase [Erwinia sp. V90_4]MDI3441733.1 SDR family oxidoreductase [Erwinia sp. V90_4]